LNNVDFYREVFNQLLGSKEINLILVENVANKIEREYKYALSYFYERFETGMYVEIIDPIKNTLGIFCKKVAPILLDLKINKKNTMLIYGRVK